MDNNQIINDIKTKAASWLSDAFDETTRAQVKDMMENNPAELTECFYRNLEFGTGGLRGIMGVGTNRMNIYTVGMATQGLCNYLKKEAPPPALPKTSPPALSAGEGAFVQYYLCEKHSSPLSFGDLSSNGEGSGVRLFAIT